MNSIQAFDHLYNCQKHSNFYFREILTLKHLDIQTFWSILNVQVLLWCPKMLSWVFHFKVKFSLCIQSIQMRPVMAWIFWFSLNVHAFILNARALLRQTCCIGEQPAIGFWDSLCLTVLFCLQLICSISRVKKKKRVSYEILHFAWLRVLETLSSVKWMTSEY